jgi:phosphopantetheinyl transferase
VDKFNKFEIIGTNYSTKVASKNCLCLINSKFEVLLANKEVFLHPQEIDVFACFKHVKRKKSYLQGRYCAKLAVINLFPILKANEICIANGVFGFPYIAEPNYVNVEISISHSGEDAVAIAFAQSDPMAVDLEQILATRNLAIQSQLSPAEINLIIEQFQQLEYGFTIIWAAKEAIAKVLKCGITIDFKVFEVDSILQDNEKYIITFIKFSQYKAIVWQVRTAVCALVIPRITNIIYEITPITNNELSKLDKC